MRVSVRKAMSRPEDMGQEVVGSNPVSDQVKSRLPCIIIKLINLFIIKVIFVFSLSFYRKMALKGKISFKYKIFKPNLKLFEQTINEFSSFLLLLPDK